MSSGYGFRIGIISLKPVRRRAARWRRGIGAWGRTGRRYLPFLLKRRRQLAAALALGVGYAALGMAEPWVMKLVLDNVVLAQPLPAALAGILPDPATRRIALLNVLVLGLVLIVVVRGGFYYYQQLLSARIGQNTAAEIRLTVYRHLHGLCARFHDRRRTGDVLTRLTADVKQLRDIFVSLPLSVAGELVLLAGMITVMLLMDPWLALVSLAALPCIGMLLRMHQQPLKQAIRTQREREGQLTTIAAEVLGAIRMVQGYGREEAEIDRFASQNKRSLRTGMKAARFEARLRWLSEITVVVVTALVVSLAARRVLSGVLSPGDMLVFIAYLRSFNRPLRRISKMAERAARGAAAGDRVLEILDQRPVVTDRPGARRARKLRGEIILENVRFEHIPSEPVLLGIDMNIEPGSRVALVGPTGAGKSTILNLIARFYDPTTGRVLIDGTDVREYRLASLRSQIAYVFQEPVMLASTIAECIRYGKPEASDLEVRAAARAAGIHEIIESMPRGYATELGERGATLSGGQRQCVAIARAMIKDAPIVLLDEPMTGLDRNSAALVGSALDVLVHGRTVVMISHDMRNVQGVDQIFVVENGRIVDRGSPDELLGRESIYRAFHRLELHAS
jgi:ATP-binding cassette, subfamily B, bacterial